ncbi:hypothetical protein [Georgenia sp. AZ-5]|uniref:hypothetical protein n=1 Tax=Georgenia sp. AZ-5 TaxID=3367526 RepID=UPI003754FDD1
MGVEQVPLRDQPDSLGPPQYGRPVHQADEPLPVTAWIHTRSGHQRVEGVAVAWTAKAVRLRYMDDHGREGYAWVWANAVTRR